MSLHLKIIQPTRILLDEECEHVIVPGIEGDFGISPGHTPFITKIRPGILYAYSKKKKTAYAVHDGFVTVENDTVRIVCEVIEAEKEIDRSRAEKAKMRAQERMSSSTPDTDFRRAEASLKRAVARLQTTDA
jgi:F-type H+-transporting ATPase subunit epsilon